MFQARLVYKYFSTSFLYKTLHCHGGHLGLLIHVKNEDIVSHHPIIIRVHSEINLFFFHFQIGPYIRLCPVKVLININKKKYTFFFKTNQVRFQPSLSSNGALVSKNNNLIFQNYFSMSYSPLIIFKNKLYVNINCCLLHYIIRG